MSELSHLLHPELFETIPLQGQAIAETLNLRAAQAAAATTVQHPGLSVVIRTLNEADRLEQLMQDIDAQIRVDRPQVIVVDNESDDDTPAVAKHYGAEVIRLPRGEFTYPRSMNLGVEAADNPVVYLTVGHALLSTTCTLNAVAAVFQDAAVAGVHGMAIPGVRSSWVERTAAATMRGDICTSTKAQKAGMGVLGATSAAVRRSVWDAAGRFDERYETGGEDTALAAQLLAMGYDVVREPLLTVHHSHGLGFMNSIKQFRHWNKTLRGPVRMDMQALLKRRPDLAQVRQA